MVILGPSFIQGVAESFLIPWQPVTVNCSVCSSGASFSLQQCPAVVNIDQLSLSWCERRVE